MYETAVLVTSITTTLGIVVWGVRQEGRINGHDTLFMTQEKTADERHTDLKDRLERIETKLDSLNGGPATPSHAHRPY